MKFSEVRAIRAPKSVSKIRRGGKVLWEYKTWHDLDTGLEFTSASPFDISVKSPRWNGIMEYCNGEGWRTWDGSRIYAGESEKGYSVYIRGAGNTVVSATDYNQSSPFVLGGGSSGIECNGNIENLLDYKSVAAGIHPTMASYCFFLMFVDCTCLTKAPSLPATTLAAYCYSFMFARCTSLTTAPSLPATTLAENCYNNIFNGCTSLTKAPSLPATTLEYQCYAGMFTSCTSLTTAPSLPATTLAKECYISMFEGCYNLITVPILPATTLTSGCYYHMFDGCTGIKLSSSRTVDGAEYSIPYSGRGTADRESLTNMFIGTGGTFTGTPILNRTYYLDASNTIV
jgi:hypothetical protein